jgi:GNAT superfamily N-acetyltransferase
MCYTWHHEWFSEEWTVDNRHWLALVEVIAEEHQSHWAFDSFFDQFPRTILVALQDGVVVGFLIFVVWEIGQHDRDHPPIKRNGEVLMEAKIIAFGVREAYRRRGIGRTLQTHTLRCAKKLGCYQVRSVSDHDHPENYQLKLSMGFAVEPMERDKPSLAFLMPL